MVAVPYSAYYAHETTDEQHLFIINAKSANVEKALAYGEILVRIGEAMFRDGKELTLSEVCKW